MASDEIINEIWEIAQENSVNPIDKEEFGKDLKKSVFAELEHATEGIIFDINNEFARALPIILHQAKANPDLIYENNGKGFSIASGILAKAVLTVKYENRFIPGTAEYQKEFPEEKKSDIIFTAAIADNLLKNYDKLTKEERMFINQNWDKLNSEQRARAFDRELDQFLKRKDIPMEQRVAVERVKKESADTDKVAGTVDEMDATERELFCDSCIEAYLSMYPEKRTEIEELKKNNTSYQIYKILQSERIEVQKQVHSIFPNLTEGEILSDDHLQLIDRYESLIYEENQIHKDGFNLFVKKYSRDPKGFDADAAMIVSNFPLPIQVRRIGIEDVYKRAPELDLDGYLSSVINSYSQILENAEESINNQYEAINSEKKVNPTQKKDENNLIMNMIRNLSEEEVADLFGDELKDLLRKKAEELGISEEDKRTLEAMIASKDDDSFADLFYDDREGFLQELEKISFLQHVKKQPVTDQEYGPTYRANAEEMVVDSKGLYKAQTDYKKYNEYDGTVTGEGSDASTSGTTVVQDNDTLEVDTINTHQPMPNSFINTARREDTDKDGKDLKDERDGGGLEDLPPENDLPDNAAPNNSAKNANFISAAKNMRATTDVMQEMGNITTIKVKEMDKKQDGSEVGDESDTIQPGEIE